MSERFILFDKDYMYEDEYSSLETAKDWASHYLQQGGRFESVHICKLVYTAEIKVDIKETTYE
jgi:hypothetical protein